MPRIALLPFLLFAICAAVTWALGKYAEISSAQRAAAGQYPRSRPYALTLPEALVRR